MHVTVTKVERVRCIRERSLAYMNRGSQRLQDTSEIDRLWRTPTSFCIDTMTPLAVADTVFEGSLHVTVTKVVSVRDATEQSLAYMNRGS